MAKVLLIDDEDKFRQSLAERLLLRGYENIALNNGHDAIKTIRREPDIDVVILDRQMPGMTGEQVLRELKQFKPELQVIMLTGYGSMDSAVETGKLDAYTYLEKPYDFDRLVTTIDAARKHKVRAMEKHEIPHIEKGSLLKWLVGVHNYRPGVVALGILIFTLISFMPTPNRMMNILSQGKRPLVEHSATGKMVDDPTDPIMGYASYNKMKPGETITQYYSRSYKLERTVKDEYGQKVEMRGLKPEEAAFRAKVMLGILAVGALFWASGALPIGITALLVGVFMYFLGVLRPDDIAQAYAKDAVIFVFGVLVVALAIGKTGLNRRIGLLLLGPSTSLPKLLFLFLPMIGIACAFLSEHALVAFIMPLFMIVYASSIRNAGVEEDRSLAVMLVLSLCFAANCGGPGSPAAGGRNAVMVGILGDYGVAPSFSQWVTYGLPFVPVMGLVIAAYFYLTFRRKLQVKTLNVSAIVHQAAEKIGPMNRMEYITAAIMILLVTLWITASDSLGMGGPVILAIVLLNVFRIVTWADVSKIQWEVVALYASACALGKGLAATGAALYMADVFLNMMPEFLRSGVGLAVTCSLFTGTCTQFMSDGATVSAIGPITVPMATLTGTHPWMVGFASAFASSFAHMLLIGTPNNAIAYAMAKDPVTGKQLVTLGDFMKHGFIVLLLSWAVLWGWLFFGYWRWIGF
ncbi:MAG: response regulator [Candidatus Zixiibacteriota bacterium]|nr:MAG: response regulator [candidate division Zixibacteria bacterium]